MALELRSVLCTFENSTKCYEISFDSDSAKRSIEYLLPVSFSCYPRLEFERVNQYSVRHEKIVVKPQSASWNIS